jgi:hypothetical protein
MTLPFEIAQQSSSRDVMRYEETDAICSSIAQQLLSDDPQVQSARQDGVLAVARVILDRRLGIAPSEFPGNTTQDKCDFLRQRVGNFDRECSGVMLHDTYARVTAVKSSTLAA